MFFLHVSNKTENLLRQLGEVIRVDKQADLFGQELFLIQSQGMERMVAQTLADQFCSFCNYKFYLPLDFLLTVAARLGMDISPDGFSRQTLAWRIDGLLLDLSGDVYQPLRYYLGGENSQLKRFQLARRLANIFDQYQLMRGDMLLGWEQKKVMTDHPGEKWQMDLWCRLLDQPGGSVHRAILFQKVIQRLQSESDLSHHLPKRISIVGLHTMPPIFLSYLNSLAHHMDVHLFLLSPCEKYWGNVETMRKQYVRQLRSGKASEDLQQEEHHQLLAALGGQGKDLQNMLLEGAEFSLEFSSYESPLDGVDYNRATLLQKVQEDLLTGSLHQERKKMPHADDNSIQLVSCHSKLRELNVLRDQLLRLLHGDEQLELRDIVVMAPDIQEYSALIPAVFTKIQHSIADRSVRRRNSVIAAFGSFLELFSGRFGLSEVMDLLQMEVVYPQFELCPADLDILQQWATDSGIRWGLSATQRGESGVTSFEESSWRAGLDRLLMGYAVDADQFVAGVLPFQEIEGRGAAPLGGLCQFIELLDSGSGDFKKQYSVQRWSELLHSYINALFGESHEQELVELRTIVADLGEVVGDYHSGDIAFVVISEWFTQLAKESRSSSGFLQGKLTFCSMLPMRSIPFKVVCILGLNDGVFPKNDHHDTFDLMAVDTRPGDRSPRVDDRYQFLEALLAARSTLYLSFVGQSMKTNDSIPPSVVVTEFVELLGKEYGLIDPVVRHPLHPFNKHYYNSVNESGFFSYDQHYCQVANAIRADNHPQRPWWQGRLEGGGELISLAALFSFYKNPLKYFVRNCLGIRLDSAMVQPEDRELFEVSGLGKYIVEQEILDAVSKSSAEELDRLVILKKIQAQGDWPLGASGSLGFDQKMNETKSFWKEVEALELGPRLGDIVVNIEIDSEKAQPYLLAGTLSNIYENGILVVRFGPLRGQDVIAGWLHHLIINTQNPGTPTYLVAMDHSLKFPELTQLDDGVSLGSLLGYFQQGCGRPLPFFVEPAFAYARQMASRRAKVPPLEKALSVLNNSIEKGYQSEWELLLRGEEENSPMVAEFEQLALSIMCSIWEVVND